MGIGNRHPVAEFNIVCDPEAAKIVFEHVMINNYITQKVTYAVNVLSIDFILMY